MNGTLLKPRWAVYHREKFWLTDTCAGGAWSETVEEAVWFDTESEAWVAIYAADIIELDGLQVCRVR